MLSLRTIQKALVALLTRAYPTYKVYFDNVEKSKAPYFYIEMDMNSNVFDDVYFTRSIHVDVTYRAMEDAKGRINRSEVYAMADSLERLIRPVLHVEDRYITIIKARTRVVDDILHYLFDLDFADAFTDEEVNRVQYELMGSLAWTINGRDETERED